MIMKGVLVAKEVSAHYAAVGSPVGSSTLPRKVNSSQEENKLKKHCSWDKSLFSSVCLSDRKLPLKHLFLCQVLHPANLHIVHVVHKAGPVRAAVSTVHGLLMGGGRLRGRVAVSGCHTVAAVANAEASESG